MFTGNWMVSFSDKLNDRRIGLFVFVYKLILEKLDSNFLITIRFCSCVR